MVVLPCRCVLFSKWNFKNDSCIWECEYSPREFILICIRNWQGSKITAETNLRLKWGGNNQLHRLLVQVPTRLGFVRLRIYVTANQCQASFVLYISAGLPGMKILQNKKMVLMEPNRIACNLSIEYAGLDNHTSLIAMEPWRPRNRPALQSWVAWSSLPFWQYYGWLFLHLMVENGYPQGGRRIR